MFTLMEKFRRKVDIGQTYFAEERIAYVATKSHPLLAVRMILTIFKNLC